MGAASDMLTSALFLAVSINLFFVVLWEVGFYFLYVTKREDDIAKKMATDLVDLFTSELWQMVGQIPLPLRKPLLDITLSELNSVSSATAKDDADKESRDKHNRKLMYYSLAMCGAFLVLVVIFGIMCGVRKIFPDQKHMWLELFVVMVGFVMFDFFFFDYIVKNFKPISSGKFQRLLLQPTLDNIKCFPLQPLPSGNGVADKYTQAATQLLAAISQMNDASTLADLLPLASSLQAAAQALGAGTGLQYSDAATPAPAPTPHGTPSMAIPAELKTMLGDTATMIRSLAQQLSVAATLTSTDFSSWLVQTETFISQVAAALQNPTADSIQEALRNLPALPQRPT